MSTAEYIVEQVKALPLEEQLRIAEAIDKMTWAERWRTICARIASRVAVTGTVDDSAVDAEVREVRREKPLSERSSTHRS